jgi:hypothetical protein
MRLLTVTLFLILTSLALAGDAPQSTGTSTAGRFQLVAATTWGTADGKTFNAQVVLKIDTQTGQTWMLTLMSSTNGGAATGFLPLENLDKPSVKPAPPSRAN